MGEHTAPGDGEVSPRALTWIKRFRGVWKALGGFIAASGASIATQAATVDWDNPTRNSLIALAYGILGAVVVYFFPANKKPTDGV